MKKISVDRKRMMALTVVASIGLAILFGAYSLVAYSRAPLTTRATYTTAYSEVGRLTHAGFFSNESVYKNGTGLTYYPSKITMVISGNYTYSTSPPVVGDYRLSLRTDYYVVSNKERIYLKNTTVKNWSGGFKGSFSIPVTFNISAINSGLKEIRDGTGLYRASGDTYLLVEVQAKGREPFIHRISLSGDTFGMLHLTNQEKKYEKRERHINTTANHIGFLGGSVRVSTARKVFPPLSAVFLLPPLGFIYSKRKEKPEDKLRELRKFIVEGKVDRMESCVVLSSEEDLGRVFDLVDRPIIHHTENGDDVYTITDGSVSYRLVTNNFKSKTR